MKVGSLFSGVGGFDLALERQGFEIEFMCDNDPRKRAVLHRHWPDVEILDDVTQIQNRNPLDVLVGGFPCQDLSHAGHRAGLAGERSSLFYEAARIAGESVRPGGWLVIENVPGLFSTNRGADFALLLRTLADLGFHDLAWRVLDSQHFGVPQRRRRVYIAARRARGTSSRAVLLEPESGGGDFTPGSSTRETDCAGFGVSATGSDHQIAGSLTKRYGKGVNTTMDDGATIIDAGLPRRLTPTEAERLQGFPDGWTIPTGPSLRHAPSWYQQTNPNPAPHDPSPDGPRYAAMGDAVTVPVVEWLGQRLKEHGQ